MTEARAVEAGGRDLSVAIAARISKEFALAAEFVARPGFTMLLGPSGGGKTTLLNCVAGIVAPDTGRIALGEHVLYDSQAKIEVPARERRVGYVFQDLALFPHLTVRQNVEYGLAHLSREHRGERAHTILESLHIAELAPRKPGNISGGERQRVAIARSLVTDPECLLLDEPLGALDRAAKGKILDDLRKWNAARKIPILYVTHSAEEAFALGERVIVLEDGKILAQGMPQEVLARPRHETIAQVVGFENVFDAQVVALSPEQGTMLCQLAGVATLIEVPLGRAEVDRTVRIAIRAGDIMIATARPEAISARNTIPGKLVALRREGSRAIATVEAGALFEVHLTPIACEQLSLAPGSEVWIVIKTYSCNLVDRRDAE